MAKKPGQFSWTLFVGVLVGLFAGVVTDGVFVSILPGSLGGAAIGIIAFVVAAFVAYLFVIAFPFVAGMGKRRAISPVPYLRAFRRILHPFGGYAKKAGSLDSLVVGAVTRAHDSPVLLKAVRPECDFRSSSSA